ncbi:MAG: ABC transporter ATP-binding protein, partial [Hyphomicrobium sp.]|nr:ABC transporter ATP-binding protein [Hyphomicrobium sp.]
MQKAERSIVGAGTNFTFDAEPEGKYAPWPTFWRIMRECIRPNLTTLAIGIAAMLVTAATAGALPFLLQKAGDGIFIGKDPSLLYAIPLLVFLLMLVRAAADFVSTVAEGALGAKIIAELRLRMFDTIAAADLAWIQRNHSGLFVSAFFNDAPTVDRAATKVVTGLFKNGLSVIFLVGAMLYMDWRLGLVALIGTPIAILNLGAQKKRIKRAVGKTLQESGDLNSMLTQTLQSMRVVKAYGQEAHEGRRLRQLVRNLRKYLMRINRSRATVGPVWEATSGLGFAAVLLYGGWQGIYGDVTLGHFMGFMAAALLAFQPMKSLASMQATLSEGLLAAGRVFALIDHASHVTEVRGAAALRVTAGAISFRDVDFAYDSGGPVLQDFNLELPAGCKLALVGPSGAGKSTVLNLILRFFDPARGTIEIDGQDLRGTTIGSVRAASALLTQDPVLFDDTIAANIAYGSEGASDAEIEAAAEAAAAHDFIMRLPNGYQTRVGESGNRLSGGERQRIAFARAMLRNTPILLLDEPTSALDAESEAKVQAAMVRLLAGRTVVMIAHRLSTVQRADQIYYMEDG